MNTILDSLEHYYDTVPRVGGARAEDFGPLTLFVQEGAGWPYYARPALGGPDATAADVVRVLARQRSSGSPRPSSGWPKPAPHCGPPWRRRGCTSTRTR